MTITRDIQPRLQDLARKFPVVTVTGPRQSGKTTLCRMAFPYRTYVSLEAPDTRAFAARDPRGFLAGLRDGVILDEVQRVPELPSYIQGLVDDDPTPGRFILTGSANFALLGAVSQSLAGRTALLTLHPLTLGELRRFPSAPRDLWETLVTGSYPAPFDRGLAPDEWYSAYVGAYVERDVRQILAVTDLTAFQTFVELCAGRTAGLLSLSGLGADAGVTHGTARAWLSVLEASWLVHRLPPFHANISRRLVKAPKLHVLDSGLACFLLGIRSADQLRQHPLRGAVFESWVVAEILKARANAALRPGLTFYRDRKGAEVDALLERGDTLVAVEAKSGQTVASDWTGSFTPLASLLAATPALRRLQPVVVYGGAETQRRTAATFLSWSDIASFDGWGP